MASRGYIEELGQIPLLSACSKRELQRVARAADEVTVEAGRTLVEQDTPGREAFVIIEGTAEVRRNGRRVARLGPGDSFGELALLDREPRTASVVADSPLRVLVITTQRFTALLDEAPGLTHKLLRVLAGRVRELDRKMYA